MFTFPFGRPVTRRPPSADAPRAVFVLGAYPSALHVAWTPPAPFRRVAALAVDDEPTPFWSGDDEDERITHWKQAVGFEASWGTVRGVGRLNGSSGRWVDDALLAPLGATRGDAWITDCLDTYRASTGVGARLADTYAPFARSVGLASARVPPHPAEAAIVREATEHHRERLRRELRRAAPEQLVTLGNAALRVLTTLIEVEAPLGALRVEGYGAPLRATFEGRTVLWHPLAHPAAPPAYQAAHVAWREARG